MKQDMLINMTYLNTSYKKRLNHSNFALAITTSALLTALSTAPTHAENLLEVYSMAYETDPVLKQVISQRQSVGEGSVQAFAAFLPKIDASASSTGTNQDKPTTRDSDTGLEAASSTIWLSRKGTRHSSEVAIVILSVSINKSSGN